MLDSDFVAVSPSSIYRVLKAAGLLQGQVSQTSRKGEGFQGPKQAQANTGASISPTSIFPAPLTT
ncbi:MAG: hypothetical protein ACRERV_06040 [Methylococcales bacterium]